MERNDCVTVSAKRRARRWSPRLLIGSAGFSLPLAMLAWVGCSSDSSNSSGGTRPDPGGTFGAEIQVIVNGRGRVVSNSPGIGCPVDTKTGSPGTCYTKYIFDSATADGAAGGIKLTATPTPGLNFRGWHFDTSPSGTGARGPEVCNPMTRPGSDPGASAGLELTLPFGEAAGTPPAGQEAACAAYTRVPLVYKVTANFDPDFPDSGADAGPSDVIYASTGTGNVAHGLGMTNAGGLYWYTQGISGTGVYYGSNPTGTPGGSGLTPTTVLSPSISNTMEYFAVGPYGVVFQTQNGIYGIRSGSSSANLVEAFPVPQCTSGLSMDSLGNIDCRTSTSSIVGWTSPSYLTTITYYPSVPSGNGIITESSGSPIVFANSTTSAIDSLPNSPLGDAAAPTPTVLVSGASSPTMLTYNASHYWWLSFGEVYVSTTKGPAASAEIVSGPAGSVQFLAYDQESSTSFWAATTTAIYYVSYPGSYQTFRTGLSGINGIAADFTYVYWTDTDGSIKRAPRSGF